MVSKLLTIKISDPIAIIIGILLAIGVITFGVYRFEKSVNDSMSKYK